MRLVKILCLMFSLALVAEKSGATVYLTVTGANVKRAKLALGKVHPLPNGVSGDPPLVKNLSEQIRADLEFYEPVRVFSGFCVERFG